MRCSGCSSADNLGNRWQVQALIAVLEKSDAVPAKQLRRDCSECRKQKGSRPVRQLLTELPVESCPDRDVKTRSAPNRLRS